MTDINAFIQSAAKQIGVPEASTRDATSGIVQMIKGQIDGGDFKKLAEKIPGVEALASGAAPDAPGGGSGGGMLGGLMGAAGAALGGGKATSLNLTALLAKSGFDAGKAGTLVSLFLGFVQKQGGADLLASITKKVPELKSLAG